MTLDDKLREPTVLYEMILNKIKFGISHYAYNCHPQNLKYETLVDYTHDRMIHLITWNLLGKEIEMKRYPSTWWDAFKDRWFPKFLKTRFPVSWDEFKIYNICPHIDIPWHENQELHIKWMEENHGFDCSALSEKK